MMKAKILTGFVNEPNEHHSHGVQGYTFAKLHNGDKWFKIGSHYSSCEGWCEGQDTNGDSNHKEYDSIFGVGNWEKEWIGRLPENKGVGWQCVYCQFTDEELGV